MEYTRDGAHGAASDEGAESSSFIVHGEGIRQDMSHAELKAICRQAAGEDVEVEMCCKVDTNTQYAFIELKTRDSAQAIQNLKKNPELASVIWKSMTKLNYGIRLLEGRPSHEYEVRVGGLSTQSPKELEKACTSFGNVNEVVMYGNYAFVYFNTKDSATKAILQKDLMVTHQENKKDQKEQRIVAIVASMNKLSIKNLPISWASNELKSAATEAGPGVLKCYITEDTYSYDKDGLIEYQNQACAEYGKKRIKSTKKLRPHKVTVTFERPTMQQEKQDFISYTIGDEKSYIDFIKDLCDKLVNRDTSGVVKDIFKGNSNRGAHRVLDKFRRDKPAQWIRIELRAGQEGKESTILAVRKHNVYIKGFTGTKDGRRRWLELPEGDKEDDRMKLPRGYKAEKLDGWSVSYNGVMKLNNLEQVKKTLSNTRLGKAFAERAVGRLSRYPDDKANNDDIPVRLAMAGLIVMICEAARMNPCLDAIAGGWTRGTGLTTRMKDIIWDWSNMSAALLKWKEDGYRKWPCQRTDSPGHALSSVYLVLNTNAKIEGDNKAWVEIFSVEVNFLPPDGMTVKVFHGENDEGHIIYKKEKQQGEQEKAAASSSGHKHIGGGVGQHEMFPLELIKPGKCSSANEWFGISVNDGDSSSSTKFKWPCREQDEPVTELVTRKIKWPCRKQDGRDTEPVTRKMDITYLVMSGAVKATVNVKVHLKVDTTVPDDELREKGDICTKQAKKQYTVRQGKISALIGDYESHQIMLLSPGEKCKIDQIDRDKLALSLPRHDVIVPYGRHQLHIKMDLNITDDSSTQVVNESDGTVIFDCNINSSDGTSSFNISNSGLSDTSGIEVDVSTSPTQTKEMKNDLEWIIGNGNKFTEFIEQLRGICAKDTLEGTESSLLIKRHKKAPPKWIHIKLKLEGEETSITLAIRDDVLFGAGFMNQAGVWYSLISPGPEAIKLLGEQYNSVSLNWGKTYSELVKPSGRTLKVAIEKLGKDFVTGAVRTLSRYPDVEDGDQPSLALAGLSVVFCESAIWEPLKEHLKNVWEMEDCDTKRKYSEPLEEYIQNWFAISRALLTNDYGSMTLPTSIKINNKQDALKHIRLVCNDPCPPRSHP